MTDMKANGPDAEEPLAQVIPQVSRLESEESKFPNDYVSLQTGATNPTQNSLHKIIDQDR